MLMGITRAVVIRLAKQLDIPLAEKNIDLEDLYAADECFLTGTAAEVLAVTKIDGRAISNGKVGQITNKLLGAFRSLISADQG